LITAYVKPTNFCNVGCSHCYLPEAVRADRKRMSFDTLRQLVAFLRDMATYGRHQGTHVLWHGGEPLTLPPEFFFEAGAILDEGLPGHTESLQTSLIPLRPDHIPVLQQRCGHHVGTSIDFSQRRIKGSVESYHDLWMKKVDLARQNSILVIPGVVPTVGEIGREAEMVRFFVERGFDFFNIDRYNAYGTSFPDRPSNHQHAHFLCGLYDALMAELERSGRAPLVGAMRGVLAGILEGLGGDRWGTTCQSNFVVVEPDGSLNTCTDKAGVEESYGNVADGFRAFATNKFRRKWIRHQAMTHRQDFCLTCENASWCKSACPITPNGAPDGEDECSGYKSFISHVRTRLETETGRALAHAYLYQLKLNPWDSPWLNYGGSQEETCAR
jgi:radical SAM protein with 4Fe4S-binding SPASM domain